MADHLIPRRAPPVNRSWPVGFVELDLTDGPSAYGDLYRLAHHTPLAVASHDRPIDSLQRNERARLGIEFLVVLDQ